MRLCDAMLAIAALVSFQGASAEDSDTALVTPMADSDSFARKGYFYEETYTFKYAFENDLVRSATMHAKDHSYRLKLDIVNNTGTLEFDGVLYSMYVVASTHYLIDSVKGNVQRHYITGNNAEAHSILSGWAVITDDEGGLTGLRLMASDGTFDHCYIFKKPQPSSVIDFDEYVGFPIHMDGTYPARADFDECPTITGPRAQLFANCTGYIGDYDLTVFNQEPGTKPADKYWALNVMMSKPAESVTCIGNIYLQFDSASPTVYIRCFGNCNGKGVCTWLDITEDDHDLVYAAGNATYQTHDRWTRKFFEPECIW